MRERRLHGDDAVEEVLLVMLEADVQHAGLTAEHDVAGHLHGHGGLAGALRATDEQQLAGSQATADGLVQWREAERHRLVLVDGTAGNLLGERREDLGGAARGDHRDARVDRPDARPTRSQGGRRGSRRRCRCRCKGYRGCGRQPGGIERCEAGGGGKGRVHPVWGRPLPEPRVAARQAEAVAPVPLPARTERRQQRGHGVQGWRRAAWPWHRRRAPASAPWRQPVPPPSRSAQSSAASARSAPPVPGRHRGHPPAAGATPSRHRRVLSQRWARRRGQPPTRAEAEGWSALPGARPSATPSHPAGAGTVSAPRRKRAPSLSERLGARPRCHSATRRRPSPTAAARPMGRQRPGRSSPWPPARRGRANRGTADRPPARSPRRCPLRPGRRRQAVERTTRGPVDPSG